MSSENFFSSLKAAFVAERPFLTLNDGRSISYGEIDSMSARYAGALQSLGLRKGDRMVVQVEKSPENVALYLGALRLGVIYVPLNTAYTAEEISYFVGDVRPQLFICSPISEAAVKALAAKKHCDHVLTLGTKRDGTLALLAANAAPYAQIAACSCDDVAVILYTSGTTGRSKGAMITHGNLDSNARSLNALWGFSNEDVLIHALPIFHIHGLMVALHTAILSSCEILFHDKYDPKIIIRDMNRASVLMGVPTFYTRLLAEPEFTASVAAGMRLFISGSAPLTTETFAAFESRTGQRILERYGMSEAGMIASNPLGGERMAGTVGFALPGVAIRISGENEAVLPPHTPGEVEVKGPNIFKGYWEMPDKTAEAFTADGWFRTGDIGALDETGRLTLVGREKDLIIAGGFNIYPVEIEQVLDAIDGVAESAVIAAPHPDMGEGVVALLVAQSAPVAQPLIEAAVASLARFKQPRRYYWIDGLPRNAMGKVQKQVLREQYKNAFVS